MFLKACAVGVNFKKFPMMEEKTKTKQNSYFASLKVFDPAVQTSLHHGIAWGLSE